MDEQEARTVLGVGTRATREEVRAAYRKLAIECHPDGGSPDDERRLRDAGEAYEALKDGTGAGEDDGGAAGSPTPAEVLMPPPTPPAEAPAPPPPLPPQQRPAAEPAPPAEAPDSSPPPLPSPPAEAPPSRPPPPPSSSRASPSPRTSGRGAVAAVAAIAAAVAFLAGAAAAGSGVLPLGAPSDSTTNDELAAMIEGLRDDLGGAPRPPAAAPAPRPATSAAAAALADDDPSKGDPGAPLTIVEFSDFQCPFCGRFYEQTLPLIERDYIETGKARLVYRDMPLDIHPQAPAAHIAAECAGDQGMFWEYHDLLFDRQGEWSRLQPAALDAALAEYAAELGLGGEFAECVRSPEAAREMQLDRAQALGMGLTGTPTFLIGGNGHDFVAISGAQPYSTFASILDGML